ncbi:MAG: cold shock and DUF1294 domain-containing protein [Moraxellaceae bacterium]|nr:cold shock and DUF1294 domain-containing protein [Moraxellaceae bacterium]
MRKAGKVVSWKDGKGFGFIEPTAGGKQVFVHIKAFPRGTGRPKIGSDVTYNEVFDSQGKVRAEAAEFLNSGLSFGSALKALIFASMFLLVVAGVVALNILPVHVLWLYLGMSLVTFVLYAMDKSAAKKGAYRTPENTLHMLALLGGWPGALYAQQLLRHKSSKQSFRVVFWITLALNVAAFVYLVSGYGKWLVEIFENAVR